MKVAVLALALGVVATALPAQQNQSKTQEDPRQEFRQKFQERRTFHLGYTTNSEEQADKLLVLRNILPVDTKVVFATSSNEIVISGSPEALQAAHDLLASLDVPSPHYRVTYTFTETDGGKRIGVQHYSMTMAAGQRMVMKEGSRVPITTASVEGGKPMQQMTYFDIGLNFDMTAEPYGSAGVSLKSRIERSALNEQKSAFGEQDPIIRQTTLEGVNMLKLGTPQTLGSIDVVGSTRQLEVEAVVEQLK